ncbi:MAG: T9SS type B sorting domain-containing protein [Flavobacteriales bacterium]|nr:T9SS type B sorting domain-containing protein [Flavobacteriales bacterium]
MKFLVLVVFISVSQLYFSQIRYYAQGFENASTTCPENWTFSGGNRTTQHAKTGTYSARVGRSGESNTLILDPVNVSLLSNATLRLNHSILGGNGPGIDVREGVVFMISLDGGAFTTVSKLAGSNDHSYSWSQTGGVNGIACAAPNDVTYQTPNTFTFQIPAGTTTVSVKIISINVQVGATAAIRCSNFVAMMTDPNPTASNFDRNDEGIYIDDVEIWADGPSVQAPITVCQNQAFSVGINNTNAGMTFAWSGPNGFTSTSQNPQVSSAATTAMSGTYSNVVSFGTCPVVTLNQLVTVNAAPNLVVSGPLVFCAGTATTLTASGGSSYQWSNGLGTNASATINTAGTYTVTASGNGTCTSQQTIVVDEITSQTNTTTASVCDTYTWTVNNQTYTQSGNYTVVNGCITENLALTITTSTQNSTTASACDSYTWNQNGSTYTSSGVYTHTVACHTEILNLTITPSTTNTSSVNVCNSYTWPMNGQTYNTSGIYTFQNGCVLETLNLTIETTPLLTFNNPTVCQGQVATLTVSSSQPGTTYLWSDGQTTSSINVSPSLTTSYSVVGSNEFGCASNGIGMVNVTPSPVLIYQDTSVCLGQSATISVSPMTTGGTYLWNTGETTASIQVSPTQNTAYTVQYTLNACQSSVATINVSIAPPFVLSANNATICKGNTATINASSSIPGGIFTWGNGSTAASAQFSPQADTTVTFSYALNGCSNSASATITILELPDLSFNASQTEGCAPLNISFTTPFLESSLCSWKIDGQEVSTNCGDLNYSFNNPNCYDISLTILGTNGCSNTVSYTDLVCVYPNPVANFYHNELANYQTSANVEFTNSSENALQNWWNFGDGGIASNDNNPTHTFFFESSASFTVELVVESEFGCRDSIQKEVSFKEELYVYIPNTFTPDQSGVNDVWLPIFSTFVNEGNYECSVFNGFGEQVFYTKDYHQAWDGTFEGKKAQDGTYTYYIQYSSLENAKSTILTGHVNLLR